MVNCKSLEYDIEKQLKEILLNMDLKAFEQYFDKLIENYYSTVYSFNPNVISYIKYSNDKYEIIKQVKQLLNYEYNNLDNYEIRSRLNQVEDIAYKQMVELHFMEKSYNDIIYGNAVQELIVINKTLTNLIEEYNKTDSLTLLATIETILEESIILIRNIKKLPLHEEISTYEDNIINIDFYKSDFTNLSETEKEDLPEKFSLPYFKCSSMIFYLRNLLEEFNNIIIKLKEINPEYIKGYEMVINESEEMYKIDTYSKLYPNKPMEEIIKSVALDSALNEIRETKGYLYEDYF